METTSTPNLNKALAAAQGEMPVVLFDTKNPFLKNRFASLGAVISTSKPILSKHGLSVEQMPLSEGDHIGVRTTLRHASGESTCGVISLPITEEKGKSRAQVAGSIITYLRRYAWSSVVGLYADEDTDGNDPRPQHHDPEPDPEEEPAPDRAALMHKFNTVLAPTPALRELVTEFLQTVPPKNGKFMLPKGCSFDVIGTEDLDSIVSYWPKFIEKVEAWAAAKSAAKPDWRTAIPPFAPVDPSKAHLEGLNLKELFAKDPKYAFGIASNFKCGQHPTPEQTAFEAACIQWRNEHGKAD